eukprot:m.123267 g.123267  ORF g.123267 m.123267 type:complete len:1065 (-) comp15566_c1_seq1:230-3424(-)
MLLTRLVLCLAVLGIVATTTTTTNGPFLALANPVDDLSKVAFAAQQFPSSLASSHTPGRLSACGTGHCAYVYPDQSQQDAIMLELEAAPRMVHTSATTDTSISDNVHFWHGRIRGDSGSVVRVSTDHNRCIRSGLVIRGAQHSIHAYTFAVFESVADSGASAPHNTTTSLTSCNVRLRTLSQAEMSQQQATLVHNHQRSNVTSRRRPQTEQEHARNTASLANTTMRSSCRTHVFHADEDQSPSLASRFEEEQQYGTRYRRNSTDTERRISCAIFLDADKSFLEAWGGSGSLEERKQRAILQMVDILFQVDGIYQNQRNFAGQLTFRIVGAAVHEDLDLSSIATTGSATDPASRTLEQYQRWLARKEDARGNGYLTPQSVCLNHMFTHTNLQGVLGVAVQASKLNSVIGGLCETRIAQSRALNAGISTTKASDNAVVAPWQTVLSTAHELGHNVGAAHTCDLAETSEAYCPAVVGTPCNPSEADGGPYLMYPSVAVDNTHSNAHFFSSCSIASIRDVLAAKGSCLEPENTCNNPNNNGVCCIGQQYAPAGLLCQDLSPQEAECQLPGVCTGDSSECPPFQEKPEGTPCRFLDAADKPISYGTCRAGQCVHLHDGYCANLGLFGCSFESAECATACSEQRGGVCRPYSPACQAIVNSANELGTWVTSRESCPVPTGASCTSSAGYSGICLPSGQCWCAGPACTIDYAAQDISTLNCDYSILMEDVCEEPCGTGLQTVFYDCMCTDGVSKKRVDASVCNYNPPPGDRRTCQQLSCDSSEAEYVQITVTPYMALDRFQITLAQALDFTISATILSQQSNGTVFKVWACRSDQTGCLSASQLISFLIDQQTVNHAYDSGFTYQASKLKESSRLDIVTIIAIAFAVAAVVITVLAVCIFTHHNRRMKKAQDVSLEEDDTGMYLHDTSRSSRHNAEHQTRGMIVPKTQRNNRKASIQRQLEGVSAVDLSPSHHFQVVPLGEETPNLITTRTATVVARNLSPSYPTTPYESSGYHGSKPPPSYHEAPQHALMDQPARVHSRQESHSATSHNDDSLRSAALLQALKDAPRSAI